MGFVRFPKGPVLAYQIGSLSGPYMDQLVDELSPQFKEAWLDELRWGCGSALRGAGEDNFFWVYCAAGRHQI